MSRGALRSGNGVWQQHTGGQLGGTRGHAQAAVQEAVRTEPRIAVVPEITTDLFGAVSPVLADDAAEAGVFKNVDGAAALACEGGAPGRCPGAQCVPQWLCFCP